MKNTTVIFLFCLIHLHAQESFISDVKVEYDVILTNSNSAREFKTRLLFNNAFSAYFYKTSSEKEDKNQLQENLPSDYKLDVSTVFVDTLENSIYFDKAQNIVIRSALDFNSNKKVLIKGAGNKLDWKISSETKSIQAFECLKATLNHEGKKYIAWFTTEIPTSFGPYEFGQLFGLILELYSEDHGLYIAATKVTYPFKQKVVLPNSDLEYISASDYDDLNKKYLDSISNAIKEKSIRILTKSQRGVNISNVKITTKKNNQDKKD